MGRSSDTLREANCSSCVSQLHLRNRGVLERTKRPGEHALLAASQPLQSQTGRHPTYDWRACYVENNAAHHACKKHAVTMTNKRKTVGCLSNRDSPFSQDWREHPSPRLTKRRSVFTQTAETSPNLAPALKNGHLKESFNAEELLLCYDAFQYPPKSRPATSTF